MNNQEKIKIREIIKDLKKCDCSFWACDGPDKPYVSMKTCLICVSIKELRTLIDGKVRIP
jgi:hypothetical protein